MYTAVIGLYALKENVNADLADAFAEICLTVPERYYTKYLLALFFLHVPLYHVMKC
jgi:hypothetical protein